MSWLYYFCCLQMSIACPQQYGRSYNSNPSNCYGSLLVHPTGPPHSMHGMSMGPGQVVSPVETGVVPPPLHCGPMPCGGQMPMKAGSMVMQSGAYGPQRRPAPYPNPQQYMQSKRGPYPNGPQGVVSEVQLPFLFLDYSITLQFATTFRGCQR